MQNAPAINEHLSPELAQIFLEGLPEKIRNGLEIRAKTMNYPVWAVIEMARCLRHATRTQVILMKKLYLLLIVSLSWISDRVCGIGECVRAAMLPHYRFFFIWTLDKKSCFAILDREVFMIK